MCSGRCTSGKLVFMCTYEYTCMDIHMHACVYVYAAHVHNDLLVHTCLCIKYNTCAHCVLGGIHMRADVCLYTCADMNIHVCACITFGLSLHERHVCICMYGHVHTCLCMHTQSMFLHLLQVAAGSNCGVFPWLLHLS